MFMCSDRRMTERTRSADTGHPRRNKQVWVMVRCTFKKKKKVFHTYVSLSSHDRHVSFTVPCKTETDGGVSVRNLCRKKKGEVLAGMCDMQQLAASHLPTSPVIHTLN